MHVGWLGWRMLGDWGGASWGVYVVCHSRPLVGDGGLFPFFVLLLSLLSQRWPSSRAPTRVGHSHVHPGSWTRVSQRKRVPCFLPPFVVV